MNFINTPGKTSIHILKWQVKLGDTLVKDEPILTYEVINGNVEEKKMLEVLAPKAGKVMKIFFTDGDTAKSGNPLLELECDHSVVVRDMCADCGKDLKDDEDHQKSSLVSMVHTNPELKVKVEAAEELGQIDKDRCHRQRKLALLVDLDQTIIHTTQNPNHARFAVNNRDIYQFQLHQRDPILYTKLRPGCKKFLGNMSKIFEMHIFTFGSRDYAHKIASFLDPDKQLFGQRISSRDECFNPHKKSGNLKHLFPCGSSMVCIIDDRDDVWDASPNLVMVNKYSYFPGSGDINNPDKLEEKQKANKEMETTTTSPRKRKSTSDPNTETPSSKKLKDDDVNDSESDPSLQKNEEGNGKNEDENATTNSSSAESNKKAADESRDANKLIDRDVYLDRLEVILKEIHLTYYDAYDKFLTKEFSYCPNVGGIAPFLRKKILFNCRLVMTGIIPYNYELPKEQHRAYAIAYQLGAVIDNVVSDTTTHLICGKKGTNKYRNAQKLPDNKIHFVGLEWLWACSERWQRVAESDYPVKDSYKHPKNHNQIINNRFVDTIDSKSQHRDATIAAAAAASADYDSAVTGKLAKVAAADARFEFRVQEAIVRRNHNVLINPLYSSLECIYTIAVIVIISIISVISSQWFLILDVLPNFCIYLSL